jgi:hypothetical protein
MINIYIYFYKFVYQKSDHIKKNAIVSSHNLAITKFEITIIIIIII